VSELERELDAAQASVATSKAELSDLLAKVAAAESVAESAKIETETQRNALQEEGGAQMEKLQEALHQQESTRKELEDALAAAALSASKLEAADDARVKAKETAKAARSGLASAAAEATRAREACEAFEASLAAAEASKKAAEEEAATLRDEADAARAAAAAADNHADEATADARTTLAAAEEVAFTLRLCSSRFIAVVYLNGLYEWIYLTACKVVKMCTLATLTRWRLVQLQWQWT
jgi:chromosome segregation ATPase